jgi:hypothetical protein
MAASPSSFLKLPCARISPFPCSSSWRAPACSLLRFSSRVRVHCPRWLLAPIVRALVLASSLLPRRPAMELTLIAPLSLARSLLPWCSSSSWSCERPARGRCPAWREGRAVRGVSLRSPLPTRVPLFLPPTELAPARPIPARAVPSVARPSARPGATHNFFPHGRAAPCSLCFPCRAPSPLPCRAPNHGATAPSRELTELCPLP